MQMCMVVFITGGCVVCVVCLVWCAGKCACVRALSGVRGVLGVVCGQVCMRACFEWRWKSTSASLVKRATTMCVRCAFATAERTISHSFKQRSKVNHPS